MPFKRTYQASRTNTILVKKKLTLVKKKCMFLMCEQKTMIQQLLNNLPCEVFFSEHVAWNRRVPGRGNLGWRVNGLRLHWPHVVMADVVIYRGGEGWREGQTSRGKERMITTQTHERTLHHATT